MIKLSLVEEKKKKKKVSGAYLTFTTGNPDYNCKMFNKRMGTDFEDQIKDATKEAEKEADAVETAIDAEAAAIDAGIGATVDIASPGEAAAEAAGDTGTSAGDAGAGDAGAGDSGAAGGEGGGAMGESLVEAKEENIEEKVRSLVKNYSGKDKSRMTILEYDNDDVFVEKFDDDEIDFSKFSYNDLSEKEIEEGKPVITFLLSGGANGTGKWENYLNDISGLFKEFKKELGLRAIIYKIETDIADDLWTAEVLLYTDRDEIKENLTEDLIVIDKTNAKEELDEIMAQIKDSKDWKVRKSLLTLMNVFLFQTIYDADHQKETNCDINKEEWDEYSKWHTEQSEKLLDEHPEVENEETEDEPKENAEPDNQLDEAVHYFDQIEKMKKLENGTRGFNAAAASDEKLRVNRQVCLDYNLPKALAIVEAEMIARGMLNSDKTTISYPVNKSYVQADDVTIADISDVKNGDVSEVCDKNKKDFRKLSLALIYALSLKDSAKAKAIKDYILDKFNIDDADLTAAIKLTISDDTIMNKITDINSKLTTESLKEEAELTEAKREVRRYYIRPQNIYCANKAGIIKALIAIGDKGENCSVYSLKNLVDNEDVHKLTNNDIIYYYDEGVLYDKNHVRIMDYDLYVKKEEKRKHFTGTDMDLEREPVKQEYEDRLTVADLPEVEPDIYEAFDLDFAPINAFGETLTEAKGGICCICGEEIDGYGNNPAPVKSEGRCCDACNAKFVIPARMAEYQGLEPEEETTDEE